MRKLVLSFFCLFIWTATFAQTLIGSWHGDLETAGRKLTLIFNVEEGENGLECSMDSPDEGVNGIEASIVATGLNVTIGIQSLNIKYEGINTGKMISGTFTQNGISLPLMLKPGRPVYKRPQEPQLPLPYECKEIVVNSGDIELHGTITLPESKDMIIIMITGSGPQNRDEEMFDHKPFLVISDRLAKEGISTFRYDDRGVGDSTGDFGDVTIESNYEDASSVVNYFKGLGYKKIGILGHSEGGLQAFLLASKGEVDFIISLAGPAMDGESILLDQNITALKQAGYTEEQLEALKSQLSGAIRQQSAGSPYLQSFIKYDPKGTIEATYCPVLALNGDKDVQVRPSINLSVIKELLEGRGNLTAIEYEGLNHLFQHSTEGTATEYNRIEETIAEQVLEDIVEWIKTYINK